MNLVQDWRRLVKKAWSIRLMALSVLFQGAELVLPMFSEEFPRRVFAALSVLALCGGIWARVVAQPKMYRHER